MKNRTLRHEIFASPAFMDMPSAAQVLYFALLCHADDDGVMRNDMRDIAARCCPRSDRADAEADIKVIIEEGFVVVADDYLVIAGFKLTQRPPGRPTPGHFPKTLPDNIYKIVNNPPVHPPRAVSMRPATTPIPKQDYEGPTPSAPSAPSALQEQKTPEMKPWQVRPSPEKPMEQPIEAVSRSVWEGRIARYRNSGAWLDFYGPEPGKPGSRVPEDML